jgi:hypothetical protein
MLAIIEIENKKAAGHSPGGFLFSEWETASDRSPDLNLKE